MKTYKDYQKKSAMLVGHYRSVFSHADYVFLASDSAMCGAGSILRDAAIGSSVMKNTPVVMVSPGIVTLCREFQCDNLKKLHGAKVDTIPGADGIPVVDEMIRYQLFDLYIGLDSPRATSLSARSLHVMLSPDSVWDESGKLSVQNGKKWQGIDEQRAIQMAVFRNHRDCSQIVISQDVSFLQSLRLLCKSAIKGESNTEGLTTLSFNKDGFLYDPFEVKADEDKLLSRISQKKLFALVQQQPTYIDDSALRHERADALLYNIKQGLVLAGKSLIVLASKREPLALSDTLIARTQENPPSVRFAWLRDSLSKTDALIETLLSETAAMTTGSKITLITDRVTRAEKIQKILAGAGVLVEIYSVNKYGFLSNRDKTQPALVVTRSLSITSAKNKQLIEKAVKKNDVQEVLSLACDKHALKNGVITCLCEKQADTLELLLKQADSIQSSIINWWILEYKQFLSPSFLMENPKFYDLLVLALSKCRFLVSQAEKWLDMLQDLEEAPTAATVELGFIISLLRNAIKCSGVTGATRIRRTDIPKVLPRTERSEKDLLRYKLDELVQKQEALLIEIEKLNEQRFELDGKIKQLLNMIKA